MNNDLFEDIYLEINPDGYPACTRAMFEEVIKCAIDITHENGTYEGTKSAVISTIEHTILDIDQMIRIYHERP